MSKPDFLKSLEELNSSFLKPSEVVAKIIDGEAFININTPKTSWTFGEYCSVEVMEKVCQILLCKVLCDLILCLPDSIKDKTRENRGIGIGISVREETPICRQFQDFMRHDDNKSELFKMLAESMTHPDAGKTNIITTSLEIVATNTVNYATLQL